MITPSTTSKSDSPSAAFATDTNPGRALRVAAIDGDTARLTALLDAGADVDAADAHGWTALMLAAKRGHGDAVCLLLDRGATVNARNDHDGTAIGYAAGRGHRAIVQALCEHGADADDGLARVMVRDTELLALLLVRGGDPNRHAGSIGFKITYATTPEDERAIQLLGAHGADPNAWSTSAGLFTPLMSAIFRRKTNIVRLLVGLGVDVNARSRNRADTPLMLARRLRDTAHATNREAETAESDIVVGLLLEAGAVDTQPDTT
jgi:ankyrin repeat protein